MANWKKVQICKVDLDTAGCGYVKGVTQDDPVEVLRGEAEDADLSDRAVLCIEVGGAGRTSENNFDHHEMGGPTKSATLQAFEDKHKNGCYLGKDVDALEIDRRVKALADYIDTIDTIGPKAIRKYQRERRFPFLSDVFAGLLLSERDPVEQFHKGVEFLQEVVDLGQDPEGTIEGFEAYASAKLENNRKLCKAAERASWTTTKNGSRLAVLETDFYGAPGQLYSQGAEIVVAYSPRFGNPPAPKFTVASNSAKMEKALAELNRLEPGWGGPASGTIIGSPRSGSRLSLEQVVEIVKHSL